MAAFDEVVLEVCISSEVQRPNAEVIVHFSLSALARVEISEPSSASDNHSSLVSIWEPNDEAVCARSHASPTHFADFPAST